MKNNITAFILILSLLVASNVWAQSTDLRFIQVANMGVKDGYFEVKIQIAGSTVYNQGDFNIRFNFNDLGLYNPTLSNRYNFTSGSYDPIGLTFIGNRVNINGNYNTGPATSVPAEPAWIDVASVRFQILDPGKTSQLVFRSSSASQAPTILFTDNSTLISTRNLEDLDVPLQNDNTTLPVTLTSFSAKYLKNEGVELKWATATEINNQEFQVERSTNSQSFVVVASVKGAGNSQEPNYYQIMDPLPLSGTTYYRLKQIDFDGKFEYSKIVAVENKNAPVFAINSIQPNPIKSEANIRFTATPNSTVDLSITDLQGKVLWQKLVPVQQEKNNYPLDNLGNLSNGIYFVRIVNEGQSDTFKIVKE